MGNRLAGERVVCLREYALTRRNRGARKLILYWLVSCTIAASTMRLSVFNQYVENYPEPDQVLVYNAFTGGFASLDASTFAILKRADAGGMLDDSERQLIDPELFDDSVGVLVESRAAEE